jgi:hypothetical protein
LSYTAAGKPAKATGKREHADTGNGDKASTDTNTRTKPRITNECVAEADEAVAMQPAEEIVIHFRRLV